MGDRLSEKWDEISASFTAWLEKFKPIVIFSFDWIRGRLNDTTGAYEWNYGTAVTSDYFDVPSGSTFKLKLKSGYFTYPNVYVYDLDHNFVRQYSVNDGMTNGQIFDLPGGFSYRFRVYVPTTVTDLDKINDYFKVYADEGWVSALLQKLKIDIIGLFVPGEEFFQLYRNDFELLLENHLGFVWTAGDFTVDIVSFIRDLLSSSNDGFQIVLPAIELDLAGTKFTLWEQQEVDFEFMESGVFKTLYGMYTVMLYIIFAFALFKYGSYVWDKVMIN